MLWNILIDFRTKGKYDTKKGSKENELKRREVRDIQLMDTGKKQDWYSADQWAADNHGGRVPSKKELKQWLQAMDNDAGIPELDLWVPVSCPKVKTDYIQLSSYATVPIGSVYSITHPGQSPPSIQIIAVCIEKGKDDRFQPKVEVVKPS